MDAPKQSSRHTFSERRKVGLDFLRYLKTEGVDADGINKERLQTLYTKDYTLYRAQIDPQEKIPNFHAVVQCLLIAKAAHVSSNKFFAGASKFAPQPESSPDFLPSKGITKREKAIKSSHRKKAVKAIDQHIPFNRQLEEGKGDKAAATETLSKAQVIEQNSHMFKCIVCQTTCTSRSDVDHHIRGRRHRLAVVMTALKNQRAELIKDKFEVNVKMDIDGKDATYYIDIEESKVLENKIVIFNGGKQTVELLHCEMLKKVRVFQFHDEKKVTDSLQTAVIYPGETYAIQVRTQAQHMGNFHCPVAFHFQLKDAGTEFHIVRFLHARCKDSIVEELKPSKQYTHPPRVVKTKETLAVVPGNKLPRMYGDELKREIELKDYKIPPTTRKLINRGLKDAEDKLTQGERLELTTLRHILESPLEMTSYGRRFECLMQFEEVQMEVDIRKYDMTEVTMKPCPHNDQLLLLEVPGLAENRPSVLRGDWLYVHILSADGKPAKTEYQGYVHEVHQSEVALGFHRDLHNKFVANMKFNVRFIFNRLPLRLQHRACCLAQEESLDKLLFPTVEMISTNVSLPQLRLCNRDLEKDSNEKQYRAVQHIVAGTSRPAPYIVFGPPGTGKTVTLVEAMNQIYKNIPNCHILACTPSNSAADLIAKRLVQGNHIPKKQILRLNAVSRSWLTVPEEIKCVSNYNRSTLQYYYPTKTELSAYTVVITTLITAGRIASANFPSGHFTHVFIDEAGHAVEPEALIAIAGVVEANQKLKEGGQVVLAGDPKQLGPILRSPFAIKYGLEVSLLERFMETCDLYKPRAVQQSHPVYDERVITKLLKNYRSHPAILKPPNDMFYQSELVPAASQDREKLCGWEGLPRKQFPVIFHSVIGEDLREEKSPSFFNPEEVSLVVKYVDDLMKSRKGGINLKQEDIGVISPYRKQVQKIQRVLKRKTYGKVRVGSVEEFQGSEKTVIIASTVRSNPQYMSLDSKFKLGFLRNPKRFNVTVTRAKALLIVIGNPQTLSKDEHWNQFIQYCRKEGGFIGTEIQEEDEEMEDLLQRLQSVKLVSDNEDQLIPQFVSQFNEQPWRKEV